MQAGGRRPGGRQGHPQNGICPQTALVVRPVRLPQQAVNLSLISGVLKQHRLRQDCTHVLRSLPNPFSPISLLLIPQLHRLKFSCGRPGGDTGAAHRPIFQDHLRLHRGISPGIQNLPALYRRNIKPAVHQTCLLISLILRDRLDNFFFFMYRPWRSRGEKCGRVPPQAARALQRGVMKSLSIDNGLLCHIVEDVDLAGVHGQADGVPHRHLRGGI